jgi:anti-anti-sigma factor
MRIHIIRISGVTVLRCHGRLVLGQESTQFRMAAERALAECDVVALDLAGVWQMDAHGIGVLAELYASARDTGRALILAGVNNRVQRLLRLTRLDKVIPTVTTVLDADAESRRCPGTTAFGGQVPRLPHVGTAVLRGA